VKSEAAPIVIEFSGEDLEILDEITVNFSQKLKSEISDIGFIETSFDVGRPQIDIEIDRRMLALNDLSLSTAINQLQDHLSGRDAGEWDDQGELKPISIRFPDIGLKELENFQIKSGERNYSLNEIAYLHKNTAPSEIFRKNQNRVGKISAQIISDRPFNKIINDIEHLLQQYELPDRYNFAISGDEKQRRESFASLKFALLLSIILVYMVMASQFESLKHPFTILLSIPFAGVGVIILYLLIGKPLNIMSYIGIIMLGGIAVNDSIILVDRIIQLKNEGLDRVSAIIEAGQQRIRPIIMTSITTILALLPLTFGYGEGAALRSPMAYAVIGGLITSTLLTLVVIPCVFLVIDSINFRRSRY